MSKQLADFYQGDTKRWRFESAADLAGATLTWRMAGTLSQTQPDLQVAALMDTPDVDGAVFGGEFEITPALSMLLDAGEYWAEHEMVTLAGDVTTFLPQRIKVLAGVPKN